MSRGGATWEFTSPVEDVDLTDFQRQIDTNFYGVVYLSKAVLPTVREQGGGHIIQISTIGGRISGPGMTAYQSAKWAVSGFSSGPAAEVAPLGIKVVVLEPGGMRTDWAGSSITILEISEPYQATVGVMAQGIRDSQGSEPSDPAKVARLVRDVAAGRRDLRRSSPGRPRPAAVPRAQVVSSGSASGRRPGSPGPVVCMPRGSHELATSAAPPAATQSAPGPRRRDDRLS